LSGFPPNNVNVYVLGDVLIDAGLALDRRRIMRQIDGRTITANALTHAHFEHHGSSHASCEQLGIRCGAEQTMSRPSRRAGWSSGSRMVPAARANPVARALKEGDEVAGFETWTRPAIHPGTCPTGVNPIECWFAVT